MRAGPRGPISQGEHTDRRPDVRTAEKLRVRWRSRAGRVAFGRGSGKASWGGDVGPDIMGKTEPAADKR